MGLVYQTDVMLLFILLTIVSFLRVLFIIILVWYAFKVAMRFLAPRVVEKAAEKIVRDMQQQQQNQTRRQGDVTVERPDMKQKQYKREQGEYVDFEEVD